MSTEKPLRIRNSTAEFLIFSNQAGDDGIEVRVADETVWLTQKLLGVLFDKGRSTITEHLQNIFATGELEEKSVCRDFRHTAEDGKDYTTRFYNLDAIIAVGFRVNSTRATQFRQWATGVLRDFAIRGYVLEHILVTTRESTEADADFVNNLTRLAMHEYVESTWHTTHERESYYQINQFDRKSTRIIQHRSVDIGRISVKEFSNYIMLDEIHLLPDYQRRGIGTLLLQELFAHAKSKQLPVRLIILRTNPAKQLYERSRFTVYHEDRERYYMATNMYRKISGFHFIKAGDFLFADTPCKFKSWESNLILDLYDERYRNADETVYLVTHNDTILYVGEYTYNLKERWLTKNYVNHHMYDKIESQLTLGKEISLWLAIKPYCEVAEFGLLNISKSLEQQIIKEYKPEWNSRSRHSGSDEWRKNCLKLNSFIKNP